MRPDPPDLALRTKPLTSAGRLSVIGLHLHRPDAADQPQLPSLPSYQPFKAWAVDYDKRLLQTNPLADGLFMDNSSGKAAAPAGGVIEPVGSYSTDYASLLYQVGRAIAPQRAR